jgi:DNA invertase Pin-like site-specific DNA recombinase
MTAAAYVRVSSRAQTHEMQRAAIERAAAARGDKLPPEKWYAERMSGKSVDRPELHRLRADVRAGAVGRLYVFRLDRITRSGIRDTLEVLEEFRRAGCEVVSLTDGFDLNGPAAEIILAVMAWASKMERLAINERIAAARERIERTGGSWGRPLAYFGGREGAQLLARALEMRKAGKSVRYVSAALKVPRATLARALGAPGPARRAAGE